MAERDEFYVGYLPQAPAALGRRLRIVIIGLLTLVAAVALVLVTRQGEFGNGVFEFGVEREFVGIVAEEPYPVFFEMLRTEQGTVAESTSYLLAAFGKRGADELVRGHHLRPVRIQGSLVYRGGHALIEVHAVEPLSTEEARGFVLPPYTGIDLGEVTLSGEVVDSKCYLGVMKPGHTKPHRACAARCISGGVPPILLVVEPDGSSRQLVLASRAGAMINDSVLPFVAERIEVTGTVRLYGELEVLYADPATYRRVTH